MRSTNKKNPIVNRIHVTYAALPSTLLTVKTVQFRRENAANAVDIPCCRIVPAYFECSLTLDNNKVKFIVVSAAKASILCEHFP